MSGSRVRENRMHGLTGGRWRSGSHGEPEPSTRRETRGTEPGHLPLADQPAAYLTAQSLAFALAFAVAPLAGTALYGVSARLLWLTCTTAACLGQHSCPHRRKRR